MSNERDLRVFVIDELRDQAAAERRNHIPEVDGETAGSRARWLHCADAALRASVKGKESPGKSNQRAAEKKSRKQNRKAA